MIKVIIADDEEKVCHLIFALIDWKALGMKIVGIAHNGFEALDLIREHDPDLVITDIRMPGYDGLEMIRRAKEIKEDVDFIIISGYRHFEYAQSAIKYGVGDYLLKPIKKEEFLNTLHKMKDKYKQRTEQLTNEEQLKLRLKSDIDKLRAGLFTETLLQKGVNTDSLEINQVNEDYHYHFQDGIFQIFAIKIDCAEEEIYLSGIEVLRDKIMQILNHLLKRDCFDMGICTDNNSIYCLLNYGKNNKKTARKQIKAVLDELMVQKTIFPHFEFTIGAGTCIEDIKGLKQSFQIAKFSAKQRLVEGTGILIEKVPVNKAGKRKEVLLAELNRTMGSALEVLDKDGVLSIIEELKQNVKASADSTGEEILEIAKQTCNLYVMLLRNYQINIVNPEAFYDNFCVRGSHCGTINQLFTCLSNHIAKSMDEIMDDKKQADAKPIRIAKQYIQDNYMNSISLEEVSNVVGFNASYFSSLFKKESGSNFLEYLSEVRMNKAKELLRETNLSIAVICEQVGYSDLKHFTKNFKKSAGIKPNEYRKLYS